MLVAVGRKLFGNISIGPQPDGASVEQGHPHGLPERGGTLPGDLAALQAQGLSQKCFGQASAGITVGAGGRGNAFARELGIEPVGAASPDIGQDGIEGMVVVEPLKEQVPEGDERGKETLIEGELFEGGQVAQGAVGQELEEKPQQVGRGEAGRRLSGF